MPNNPRTQSSHKLAAAYKNRRLDPVSRAALKAKKRRLALDCQQFEDWAVLRMDRTVLVSGRGFVRVRHAAQFSPRMPLNATQQS